MHLVEDVESNLMLLAEVASQPAKAISSSSQQYFCLQAEVDMLQKENKELKEKLLNAAFSFSNIAEDEKMLRYYTGLPDAPTFYVLLNLLRRFPIHYHATWVPTMNLADQLLLTLMKLKLNLDHLDLSVRFNTSTGSISNIFITLCKVLHDILYIGILQKIPSRQKNAQALPACFTPFPNCRMILDCTEVSVHRSEDLHVQCATYSNYKSRNTLKALIGIAPNGTIVYVSDLYGGSVSDKAIVQDSGILKIFEPGDLILADKGFTIQDILPAGVQVNHPTYLTNGQFTHQQVQHDTQITRARIHVERAIQRIKTFRILDLIPFQYKRMATVIFQVCACLVNFQTPILNLH